jgi:hypothetical protein
MLPSRDCCLQYMRDEIKLMTQNTRSRNSNGSDMIDSRVLGGATRPSGSVLELDHAILPSFDDLVYRLYDAKPTVRS